MAGALGDYINKLLYDSDQTVDDLTVMFRSDYSAGEELIEEIESVLDGDGQHMSRVALVFVDRFFECTDNERAELCRRAGIEELPTLTPQEKEGLKSGLRPKKAVAAIKGISLDDVPELLFDGSPSRSEEALGLKKESEEVIAARMRLTKLINDVVERFGSVNELAEEWAKEAGGKFTKSAAYRTISSMKTAGKMTEHGQRLPPFLAVLEKAGVSQGVRGEIQSCIVTLNGPAGRDIYSLPLEELTIFEMNTVAREGRGLSVNAVARDLSVIPQTVRNWEKNTISIYAQQVIALGKLYFPDDASAQKLHAEKTIEAASSREKLNLLVQNLRKHVKHLGNGQGEEKPQSVMGR